MVFKQIALNSTTFPVTVIKQIAALTVTKGMVVKSRTAVAGKKILRSCHHLGVQVFYPEEL